MCPNATWSNPKPCEGIGGLSKSDDPSDFEATSCEIMSSAEEMRKMGKLPVPPIWPSSFVNTGFYEQQIFVKRDPFCFAQIPSMVSNGTHCFKNQQGVFNYDATKASLRIDYIKSSTVVIPKTNMTEHFYHIQDAVHPSITKYGVLPTAICPCITLGVGPVSPDWAKDAVFLAREKLGIEFLWEERLVDHYVKGPHHVWSDVETGNVVRMYQPFNGLEVFDPNRYETLQQQDDDKMFELPLQCKLDEKLGCINGNTSPTILSSWAKKLYD